MKVSCDSYTQCYPQVAPLGTALDSCKASSRIWHIRGIEFGFQRLLLEIPSRVVSNIVLRCVVQI